MTKREDWAEEGRTIRAMREGLGLSRTQLAARLGVSASTLKGAENGQQRLGARTFRALEQVAARLTAEHGRPPMLLNDSLSPYDVAPSRPAPSEAEILRTIEAAGREEIQQAAKALADATGMSHPEALAAVVTKYLHRRA